MHSKLYLIRVLVHCECVSITSSAIAKALEPGHVGKHTADVVKDFRFWAQKCGGYFGNGGGNGVEHLEERREYSRANKAADSFHVGVGF